MNALKALWARDEAPPIALRASRPGWPAHSASFLIPAIVATNYTLNRFYVLGAAMWDTGWFAHLAATGLRNPPAIGGSYLSDHMSLIFVLTAFVHSLLPDLPAPVFFSFLHGACFGVVGLAASMCLQPLLWTPWSILASVLCALNGICLAAMGFPKIELMSAALILLMLACWGQARRGISWALLPLLLSIREDAGLHLALIFGLLALWRWSRAWSWRSAWPEAAMTLSGLAGSAILLAGQELWFVHGIDQLHDVYLGSPPLAHVDWQFLCHRIYRIGQNRSYIYIPLLVILGIAIRRRDALLSLGPLSGVPWVLLAVVARFNVAGELQSYYAFPLMIGLCWPLIAMQPALGGNVRVGVRLGLTLLSLSVPLFALSGGMHDRRPWNSFWFPAPQRIAATERALDTLLGSRPMLGSFVVDDAVAALRPSAFDRSELRGMMAFTSNEISRVQAMVFQPVGWLAERKAEIIRTANLGWRYSVPGTSLLICSREPLESGLLLLERHRPEELDSNDTETVSATGQAGAEQSKFTRQSGEALRLRGGL